MVTLPFFVLVYAYYHYLQMNALPVPRARSARGAQGGHLLQSLNSTFILPLSITAAVAHWYSTGGLALKVVGSILGLLNELIGGSKLVG